MDSDWSLVVNLQNHEISSDLKHHDTTTMEAILQKIKKINDECIFCYSLKIYKELELGDTA